MANTDLVPARSGGAISMRRQLCSSDGSIKFLWDLQDGEQIESVYFRLKDFGHGLCLSTQAGCNVGCTFCATARQKAARNLRPDEIFDQWLLTQKALAHEGTVPNWRFITFAGMGEPLLNYDNLMNAADRLRDLMPSASITLSTSGIVPGIQRLAANRSPYGLLVSLHATTDEVRQQIIPVTSRYPIAEVVRAARQFAEATGRRVTMSYLLFAERNDTAEDAARLRAWLDPQLFEVQLLLWNEIEGIPFRRISSERATEFRQRLTDLGLKAYIMASKARDVQGGCGQLVTRDGRKRVLLPQSS